jgi:hypothetical protein
MKHLGPRALLLIVLGGGAILMGWISIGSISTAAWAQPPAAGAAVPAQNNPDDGPPPVAIDEPKVPSPPAVPRPYDPEGIHREGMGRGGVGWGRPRGGGGMRMGSHAFGPGNLSLPHPMSPEEMEEFRDLQKAVEKLKSAKNDAEKTSATSEISKLLEKSFQHDLERREHQVSDIEARVKKLRDQIEKRKKAKDEIVSLRLKTIVNEADGLGFPGGFERDWEVIEGPPGAMSFPPTRFHAFPALGPKVPDDD